MDKGVKFLLAGSVCAGFFWPVTVLWGNSGVMFPAMVIHFGQALGCLCVIRLWFKNFWCRSSWEQFKKTAFRLNGVRWWEHLFVGSVICRLGLLLEIAALLWTAGAVVSLVSSASVLLYIPLAMTREKLPSPSVPKLIFLAGGVFGVWLVSASQSGNIADGLHIALLLVVAGNMLNSINFDRNIRFADAVEVGSNDAEEHRIVWSVICVASASVIAGTVFGILGLVFETGSFLSSFQSFDALLLTAAYLLIGTGAITFFRTGLITTQKSETIGILQTGSLISIAVFMILHWTGALEVGIANWLWLILGGSLIIFAAFGVSFTKNNLPNLK